MVGSAYPMARTSAETLGSTLYKSTTYGLHEEPYKTKAVIALESATDFFTGQPKRPDKDQIVKNFPTFPNR